MFVVSVVQTHAAIHLSAGRLRRFASYQLRISRAALSKSRQSPLDFIPTTITTLKVPNVGSGYPLGISSEKVAAIRPRVGIHFRHGPSTRRSFSQPTNCSCLSPQISPRTVIDLYSQRTSRAGTRTFHFSVRSQDGCLLMLHGFYCKHPLCKNGVKVRAHALAGLRCCQATTEVLDSAIILTVHFCCGPAHYSESWQSWRKHSARCFCFLLANQNL